MHTSDSPDYDRKKSIAPHLQKLGMVPMLVSALSLNCHIRRQAIEATPTHCRQLDPSIRGWRVVVGLKFENFKKLAMI